MGRELTEKDDEKTAAKGTLEPPDNLADIDPADFWDREEFGYRHSQARLLTTGGHG